MKLGSEACMHGEPALSSAQAKHALLLQGNAYLDCISNVQHVGHAHPVVAQAVAEQLFELNANSELPWVACHAEWAGAAMHNQLLLHTAQKNSVAPRSYLCIAPFPPPGRFLHAGLANYSEALAATMPDPLQVRFRVGVLAPRYWSTYVAARLPTTTSPATAADHTIASATASAGGVHDGERQRSKRFGVAGVLCRGPPGSS